ncbi:MAG: hypothetical protein EP344_02925 [Bacteroidetes bacterium]|nr:MAG: hypothetical protein EP344_02925 [Bacteroidota bacterium]
MLQRFTILLRFILLSSSLFLFSQLQAQTEPAFPEEPNEFVDKLGDFMTRSKRPDMEESFAVFKRQYKEGRLSREDIAPIARVTNILASQRLSPYPYYKSYINAVTAAKMDPDTALFRKWNTFVERALQDVDRGRTRPIAQLLDFSADFMEQRAFQAREAGLIVWKVRGGSFEFLYEDKIPSLHCTEVDLVGVRKTDSTVVQQTTGTYFPYEGIWKGEGGKVTWEAAGLDASVYARLTDYRVEAKKPLFKCDSAEFFYPLYFPNGSIWGFFEENVVVANKGVGSQYPRFESFDKSLKIAKIGEGIEYVGGFKLWGTSVFGYGNKRTPAQLTIYNKKRQKIFFGTAELFIIKREVSIVAEEVNAKLYMDSDSLFHPAVDFRVEIPDQIIHLSRGDKGSERNPFFSSFYNMNLEAEKVSWYVAHDSLEIGSRTGLAKGVMQKVEFESSNRFDPGEYIRMQNITSVNPISVLYRLVLETPYDSSLQNRIISDDAFAVALNPKFDYSNIQTLLAEMVAAGFINYYFDRHEIEPRPKLAHYALASQGKKDFDSILIESESLSSNAKLDLKNKETTIYEVKRIELSSRQKTGFIPDQRAVTLLKNRDMRFGGRLFAGFALFEGNDMYFNYEKFHVEFDSVRHLDFYLPTGAEDKRGQPIADAMNSTVEYVSGVLLVDAPNNKSGKEDLSIFPSLQSKKHSFVFYDRSGIQGGVYTRDSFYFELDPFSFNGLDSYTADQLRFKGEMFPSGIFAPFRETIEVREHDKSFGFIHRTPKEGYPTYFQKGNYTGQLDLSNKGFLGKGTVEYLTADIESEDIVFRPRQMTCTARKFFMEEDRQSDVKVPQAQGEDVKVNWLPYRDSMYVESKAKDFELFVAPGYTHKGVLVLTPSGLKGRGEFEWFGGKLTSRIIAYGPFQASSDTADLQIKALNGSDIVFDSRNVDGELDFDKQTGVFKANTADATTTLPLNKYRTSMNEFTWDMKEQTVTFKSDEKEPGRFVSIDANQDTLQFLGKTALYDMKNSQLMIGGVEVIKSADAYIYPSDGNIEVEAGGKLKQLQDARIEADTVSKYHTINRATVDILGKKLYKATGYYEYNIPEHTQEVFFNNIVGERRGPGTMSTKNVLTTASGDVSESDSFHMDIKTLFQGKVILSANQQNLRFEGFGQLKANYLSNPWFSVYTEVDKNDPTIRVKNLKTFNGDLLFLGFFLSRESGMLYPRTMEVPFARVDRPIINCEGVFKYDPQKDQFIFGDSTRVTTKGIYKGPKMVYENQTGVLQAEGPLNIGSGLEYMKVKAAGRIKTDYNIPDTAMFKVTGEFMTGIEMIIPKSLIEMVVNDIRASSFDAAVPPFNSLQAFYQPALNEFIEDGKDLEESMANLRSNYLTLPRNDNKYAFVLGRHPVIWNPEYQSFLSLEDRIPIVSINGEPIQKMLSAYVEYKMPGNQDDRFYLYIKASADLWYFFGYQAGALNVVSSSTRFNDALLSLKSKETQIKMPDGELYEIVAANPSLANAFVNRVRNGRKWGTE